MAYDERQMRIRYPSIQVFLDARTRMKLLNFSSAASARKLWCERQATFCRQLSEVSLATFALPILVSAVFRLGLRVGAFLLWC